jgi:hypothetical protein
VYAWKEVRFYNRAQVQPLYIKEFTFHSTDVSQKENMREQADCTKSSD